MFITGETRLRWDDLQRRDIERLDLRALADLGEPPVPRYTAAGVARRGVDLTKRHDRQFEVAAALERIVDRSTGLDRVEYAEHLGRFLGTSAELAGRWVTKPPNVPEARHVAPHFAHDAYGLLLANAERLLQRDDLPMLTPRAAAIAVGGLHATIQVRATLRYLEVLRHHLDLATAGWRNEPEALSTGEIAHLAQGLKHYTGPQLARLLADQDWGRDLLTIVADEIQRATDRGERLSETQVCSVVRGVGLKRLDDAGVDAVIRQLAENLSEDYRDEERQFIAAPLARALGNTLREEARSETQRRIAQDLLDVLRPHRLGGRMTDPETDRVIDLLDRYFAPPRAERTSDSD